MSDSVKQKRPIHCPLFYWGFFISAKHQAHQLRQKVEQNRGEKFSFVRLKDKCVF